MDKPLLDEKWEQSVSTVSISSISTGGLTGLVKQEGGSVRLKSLDYFRGFTVSVAAFVMFLGLYDWTPDVLRHNRTYCSIADLIFPFFYTAVGMGYRLTQLKIVEREGHKSVIKKTLSRCFKLLFIAFYFYGIVSFNSYSQVVELGWGFLLLPLKSRDFYQTLSIIAVCQILLLPVITRSWWIVSIYSLFLTSLHVLLSYLFWYQMAWEIPVINGGSIGTLSNTVPMVVGILLYDWVKNKDELLRLTGKALFLIYPILAGLALMILGYVISCVPPGPICYDQNNIGMEVDCEYSSYFNAPPFFPPNRPVSVETMSQRSGSVSYLIFSAGAAVWVYIWFHVTSDMKNIYPKFIDSFLNHFALQSLIVYMIRDFFFSSVALLVPFDSPWWYSIFGLVLMMTGLYLTVRYLCTQKLFLRL